MKKDKTLPKYYSYWDERDYNVGEIDFINGRRNHPHRSFFVNWIANSPHIKSIIEIGPGEMIEYEKIALKRPDIKYSISDIALMFLENCEHKYPNVDTYQVPLERLTETFVNRQFDCLYQAAVLEHSPDIAKAIKNCIYISKEFHFVFFKWRWSGGDLKSKYYKSKNLYSTQFNIWKIIEEIEKYANIEYTNICMKNSGEIIPFSEFSKGKQGKQRSGDYLMIHGKQK